MTKMYRGIKRVLRRRTWYVVKFLLHMEKTGCDAFYNLYYEVGHEKVSVFLIRA
jgi:hypothetical protein